MSKHTPGPWTVHPHGTRRFPDGDRLLPWCIVPLDHAERPLGAATDPEKDRNHYAQQFCHLDVGFRHRSDEEIWANARLIAAAPELLEAAHAVCRAFSEAKQDMEAERNAALHAYNLCRAAIAKAGGLRKGKGKRKR